MSDGCEVIRDTLVSWVGNDPLQVIDHVHSCEECRCWIQDMEEIACSVRKIPFPPEVDLESEWDGLPRPVLGTTVFRVVRAALIAFLISSAILIGFHLGHDLQSPRMAFVPTYSGSVNDSK